MKRELYPDKNLVDEQIKQKRISNTLAWLGVLFGIAVYFYFSHNKFPIQEELTVYFIAIIILVVLMVIFYLKSINQNRLRKIGSEYILIRDNQLIYHTTESEKKYNLTNIKNFEIIPRSSHFIDYLVTNLRPKTSKKDILGVRINFHDGKYLNLLHYNIEELREIFKELNVNKQIFGMLENFYQYNFGDLKNKKKEIPDK